MSMIIISVMMSLTLQVSGAVLSTLHTWPCLIPMANTRVSTVLSQTDVEIKALEGYIV